MSAKSDEFSAVLGEPVMLDFSEYAEKLRRNLLVFSFLTILFICLGLELQNGTAVVGIVVTNLPERNTILKILGLVNGYLVLHFVWVATGAFREWLNRRSAIRPQDVQTRSDMEGLVESVLPDPRQASLNQWWLGVAVEGSRIIKGREELLRSLAKPDATSQVNFDEMRRLIKQDIELLEWVKQTFSNEVIISSLGRYEASGRSLVRSENMRWIILEFTLPTLMGLGAIVGSFWHLFPKIC